MKQLVTVLYQTHAFIYILNKIMYKLRTSYLIHEAYKNVNFQFWTVSWVILTTKRLAVYKWREMQSEIYEEISRVC